MKKESTHQYLVRRLKALKGMQSQIARETGVSQATVNRISLGNTIPGVDVADLLVAWLDRHDKLEARIKNSASRLSYADKFARRSRAAPLTVNQ